MKEKRVTLKDIAEAAGVSLTAASMYLNGKAKQYNLADATCERIEKAIREKKFVPNFHARAIAAKRTCLAGVLISTPLESSFWLNIISAMEEVFRRADYHILLSISHGSRERELSSLNFMRMKGVDGIILNPLNSAEKILDAANGLPLVTLNRKLEGLPGVWNDNYHGGSLAAEYLLRRGHRRIAYIGGAGTNRIRAYRDLMKKNRIQPVYFQSVSGFMKEADSFTAVMCFSDYILLEVYQAAAEKKIPIPKRLSVIGYDNMDFIRALRPAPSTVSQYKNELGSSAANMLLDLLNRKPFRDVSVFHPELIPGKSVKNLSGKTGNEKNETV